MDLDDVREVNNKIIALGERARFVGKADTFTIESIEQVLEVTLPDSFKWFLSNFGLAMIPRFMIIGNGLDSIPACVKSTLDWREYGLPDNLVVIEDEGTDWIYCLDTLRMVDGECPVVDWEKNKGIGQEFYDSFIAFFNSRLEESLQSG